MITPEAQRKGAEVLKIKADMRARIILGLVDQRYTSVELAQILNVHESSVRTIVHRARKRLGVKVR